MVKGTSMIALAALHSISFLVAITPSATVDNDVSQYEIWRQFVHYKIFLTGPWPGGVMESFGLTTQKVAGSSPLSGNNLQQLVHTHAPLLPSNTCNLATVKGRWSPEAGKVTVGLALHWPCVTDFSGLSTYVAHGLRKGDEHPTYTPHGVWHTLP